MASPLKPWERAGINSQNTSGLPPCCQSGAPNPLLGSQGAGPAPTLPPRPTQRPAVGGYGSSLGYSGYGGVGMGGGMYGSSPYSSPYSMYGGGMGGGMYGGYGYGGRQGYGGDYVTNSFVQQAEDSTRPAFQSIESIVQAFTSISMMLDSTYYAVYNSFRAVLGVADQFSRMKNHFTQILSAFALIRTLKWLYRKMLVLLGLRQGGLAEDVWSQAADASLGMADGGVTEGDLKKKSNWPVIMFLAVTLGGPWLIWKLISSFTEKQSTAEWQNGNDDHFVARALYDFSSQDNQELSFRQDQLMNIAPKELQPRIKGWLLGCVDGNKVGIIPANYVKILGKRRGKNNQSVVPKVLDETKLHPGNDVLEETMTDVLGETLPDANVLGESDGQSDSTALNTDFDNSRPSASKENDPSANSEDIVYDDSGSRNTT